MLFHRKRHFNHLNQDLRCEEKTKRESLIFSHIIEKRPVLKCLHLENFICREVNRPHIVEQNHLRTDDDFIK